MVIVSAPSVSKSLKCPFLSAYGESCFARGVAQHSCFTLSFIPFPCAWASETVFLPPLMVICCCLVLTGLGFLCHLVPQQSEAGSGSLSWIVSLGTSFDGRRPVKVWAQDSFLPCLESTECCYFPCAVGWLQTFISMKGRLWLWFPPFHSGGCSSPPLVNGCCCCLFAHGQGL